MRHKPKYHQPSSVQRFWNYLFGKLSQGDQHAFEKQMLSDPFEADALEGLSQLSEDELAKDLNILNQHVNKASYRKVGQRKIWLAAAMIAIIAGLISVLTLLTPPAPLQVSHNLEKEIPPKESLPVSKEEITKATQPIALKEATTTTLEEELNIETEQTTSSSDKIAVSEAQPAPVVKKQKAPQGIYMERIRKEGETVMIKQKKEAPVVADLMNQKDTSLSKAVPAKALTGTLRGQELTETASDYDDVVVIKGIVMDANKDPLPGASIYLKGTNKGTISQVDGSYQLAIDQRDSARPIMAGFIGYVSAEHKQQTDSVNFVLEPELLAMDEVVVSGYGSEREEKIVTETFVPAQPPVEMNEYIKSIEQTLDYPADGSGKKETIVLWLTISNEGRISDIAIKRSPGDSYSFEAIDKLRKGPAWLPATKSGIPVEDKVKLKLRFFPD